ncbi:hypothetical protein NSK_002440 [Nannochloropsis salina CCMP1776]|uniref:5'-nucleotidase n=1 Tax=Nannochloropsis salina CCMP1776 TaxID=1027361 RepID=A0A4D9D3W6_9STRA|nr:hypothetical protein NSK_002440 [Nannochloropsis salina CCMP1776]|eukprot:TFJ86232.1 hypothetical protein NSK_002440 [Nannochloropsis salina CCMP1776]
MSNAVSASSRVEMSPLPVDGGHVVIRDPASFLAKKAKIASDGPSKLQLLFDWDFTLTHFFLDGRRACSCHKAIEDCDLLSAAYHEKAQALQEYYYAKEVDPSLSVAEKVPLMEAWVRRAHDLLIHHGFRRSLLPLAVKHAHLAVREGCQEVMDLSARAAVPLLVFSAGIADVLEEVCRQQLPRPLPDTVHVVSNRMVFSPVAAASPADAGAVRPSVGAPQRGGRGGLEEPSQAGTEDGVLVGFTEPVFHVFNKRAESVLDTSAYFHQIDYEQRKHAILVGDSLGDLHMSDGLELEEIIKVGLLNDRVEERLDEYSQKFDVVLLGDGDLTYIIGLLRELIFDEGKN